MTFSIYCENLSKLYRLGPQVNTSASIRKKLKSAFTRNKSSLSDHSDKLLTEKQLQGAPDGYFWALHNINLEIQQGDRVAIMGRNGSGKSTLLKIFSKITRPTRGIFKFRGRIMSLLEVGAGFHHELTGKENIFLNGAIMGMSLKDIKQCYPKIVEFSELEKFIDTPIKHYSSGMHVRLAFAVAAFLQSEILIIDEILAMSDAAFQKKCVDKMFEMTNEQRRTLLFVSHDMTAIHQICDKAIALSQGEIMQQNSNNSLVLPMSVEKVSKHYLDVCKMP